MLCVRDWETPRDLGATAAVRDWEPRRCHRRRGGPDDSEGLADLIWLLSTVL